MIEFSLDNTSGEAKPSDFAVSVIGIGGAGTNVIDRIALEGMPGADLICMNCDVRALTTSMATRKVQLGRNLTQGLGCGGDPELGGEAAESSEQEIRDLIAGRSMVFLCVGLGGGTGSGAATHVARMAREAGAFVVVFATLPFAFEGRRRNRQAVTALTDLRRYANALVTFENDRMGELVVPKKGVQEAFEVADRIIGQSVRAVTSLVTQPGLIHIGMDDLITALRNTDSRCLFGFGQAKGDNRSSEALAQALKSPLLDRGQMLSSARNVLVHVCGGSTLTLFEIETLMADLSKHVSEDAQILFGAATDAKLGEHLTVTILTSLNKTPAPELFAAPPEAVTIAPRRAESSAAAASPNRAAAVSTGNGADTQRPVKVEARRTVPRAQPATPPQDELFAPASPPAAEVARKVATVQQIQPAGRAKPKAPEPEPVYEETEEEEPEFFAPEEVEAVAEQVTAEVRYEEEEPLVEEEDELEDHPVAEEEQLQEEEEEAEAAPAPVVEARRQPMPPQQQPQPVQAEEEEEEAYEEAQPAAPAAHTPAPSRAPQAFPQNRHDGATPKRFVLSEIVKRPASADSEDDAEFEDVPAPPAARRALPPQPREPMRREPDPERLTPIRPIPAQPPARSGNPPTPFQPARQQQPQPPALSPMSPPRGTQENFDERLSPQNRGRFERVDPTLEEGEDLDVPTFLRKKQ